jgi:hypothetical protein
VPGPLQLFCNRQLEQWLCGVQLAGRVDQDWQQRCAAASDKPLPPRIEGLTVRVVNVTHKAAEVKPQFKAHFQESGYPEYFKFKQKVILLFQTIEGVDVLLFIVYVQVCLRLHLHARRPDKGRSLSVGRHKLPRRPRPCLCFA